MIKLVEEEYPKPSPRRGQWWVTLWKAQILGPTFDKVKNIPEAPFGLIVDADRELADWQKELRKWQEAGAVWFAGAGRDGEVLHDIWDTASIMSEEFRDADDARTRMSMWYKTVQEAIEDFYLIGTDETTDEGEHLSSCVVLTAKKRTPSSKRRDRVPRGFKEGSQTVSIQKRKVSQ
jgi:hypothetical protein